ncbi:hypothetical protein AD006_31515 (plasmid) [Pseudonocardia sp. EC080610-09]|nr:hypothetical protein AD006_31515 [Pseudonocardia sp. EC080610-09]ALL85359.1 hypothetical protein AD017_29735 [Pseudonocardia sp. EC080619-01]
MGPRPPGSVGAAPRSRRVPPHRAGRLGRGSPSASSTCCRARCRPSSGLRPGIAIRRHPAHGGYHDQVLAFRRISPTELIAVAAVREAGAYPDPDTAIAAADWHITTYRPQIGSPTSTELQM